ncbi:class I SAM-dependent methyltransferase [Isoptericola halotolerans]
MWAAGDWDEVAGYVQGIGPRLLDALDITPGMTLLDIAAGSGSSVAIPAALRGADVVASDLVAQHFEAGRRRARRAGADLEWVEADALDLPFADGAFDRVASAIGHMFAPDHALAASEAARVCRPGGFLGFACWTPEGVIGQMFRATSAYLPPPPAGSTPPPLWGDERHVRDLLEPLGLEVRCERLVNVFVDDSIEAYHQGTEKHFGPLVAARETLDADSWDALRTDLDRIFRDANLATDGTMRFEGEYLQIIAHKPDSSRGT